MKEGDFFNLVSGFFSKASVSNFSVSDKQKELENYYLKSKEEYDSSELVVHKIYDYATELVEHVIDTYIPDNNLPIYLIELMIDVTVLAIRQERFFDFPLIDFSKEIPLSEQLEIKYQLEDFNQRTKDNDGMRSFFLAFIQVLKYFLFSIQDNISIKSNGNIFDTQLINFTHNLNDNLHQIFMSFFKGKVDEVGIFQYMRYTLLENADMASGYGFKRSYNERMNGDSATMPQNSKLHGSDLISAYFQDTYIERLFEGEIPLSIPSELRLEHCHILAGTGHGKTQLIQKLILDDLDAGRGFMVIDSQGDLIRKISNLNIFNPSKENSLADRLIIVNPEDINFPVALNMFSLGSNDKNISDLDKQMLINSAIDLYEYMFGALFGAELTSKQGVIFRYVAKLMMEIPDSTIHTLRELIENGKKFQKYIDRLDGSSQHFFKTQFFSTAFGSTKKQILSRLWAVLSNQTLENLFSSATNKVDLFEAMNTGKIVLINTSKQLLQAEGSQILGRFFIALLSQAVIKRATIPESQRKDFMVYIDEAHEYIDEKIENMLNQGRKYKVGFTLAHQNLHQIGSLKNTIFSSTSIKLVGGISAKDATDLSYEMKCSKDFLLDMKKSNDKSQFACYLKNHLNSAVPISFEFGLLEKRASLSHVDYRELIENIRDKYCQPKENLIYGDTASEVVEEVKKVKEKIKPAVIKGEKVVKVLKKEPHKKETPKIVQVKLDGRGGEVHTYLQNLVKKIGQEKGFYAVVESKVFDGLGSIDVSLSGFGKKIAVEVSVSTGSKWESSNISKCFSASYDYIIILASEKKHLGGLRRSISSEFSGKIEEKKLLFFIPEQLISFLNKVKAESASEEKTVLGYKVKVSYATSSKDEAQIREEAIAKVILNN